MPLPCQVEILHLEDFKTCAKHVPPGPQTLPCSFSPLPALCHRPLPLPCHVEILHLEGCKTCAKHVPPGPQNPPCSFSPLPQRFARSNIVFRRFPHLRQARFTIGQETLLCSFHPLPLLCQVEILHLEGFKTCAKHVPPGPQTLPCSFSPLPALCHRPLPLPCQVEILHLEGFKTCAKHFPPGPRNPPCSFSPLPALCQVEYCI